MIKLTMATWGFFPEWLKSQKNSKPLFNTRWETIQEKRTFQSAFKKHRCLVPISGWYEWRNVDNEKQPYYFYKEDHLLKAAGLYWLRSSGNVEFSIITKEAYGDLSSIHHRTPLILRFKANKLCGCLKLMRIHFMKTFLIKVKYRSTFHRVNKSVNNPKNKNSSLIKEYTEVPF